MDNNLHNISTKYFDQFDLSDNVKWFNGLFDEHGWKLFISNAIWKKTCIINKWSIRCLLPIWHLNTTNFAKNMEYYHKYYHWIWRINFDCIQSKNMFIAPTIVVSNLCCTKWMYKRIYIRIIAKHKALWSLHIVNTWFAKFIIFLWRTYMLVIYHYRKGINIKCFIAIKHLFSKYLRLNLTLKE